MFSMEKISFNEWMYEVEWVSTTGMMMSKNGIQFELQKPFVREGF